MSDKDQIEKKEELSSTVQKKGILEFLESKKTDLQQYMVGSGIFIFCLIFLFIIYIFDRFSSGDYTGEILEIVKTLCFTICGYLFGRPKLDE